jgi:hypothetical protein
MGRMGRMGRKGSVVTALILVTLVAFGGSVSPLQLAVEASPYTYYHFSERSGGVSRWGCRHAWYMRAPIWADIEILARAGGKTVGC